MSNDTNYIKINGVDYYEQLSASLENLTANAIVTAVSDIDNKTDITSIEIKVDSAVTIGATDTAMADNGAFYGCSNLVTVSIDNGSNDINIDAYAFYDCSNLVTVSIVNGSNNINIGAYAFYKCTKLTTITLNDANITIDKYAFSHCESLANNTINSLINNITIINDFSFENCNELVELDIPARITKIGNDAFRNCANLVKVKLNCVYDVNDIVKISNYIGINAFAECVKLAILDLSEGFTTDKAIDSILPRINTSGYSGLVITKDTVYTSNPKSFSSYPILYAPFAQSIRDVVYDILSGYTLALDSFNSQFLPLIGCDKSNTKTQMKGDIIFNNNNQSLVGIGIDNNNSNKNNLTLTYYNNTEKDTVNLSLNSTNDNSFDITVNGATNNIVDTYDVLDEEVFGSDITIKTGSVGSTQNVSKTLSISINNTLSWSGNTLSLNGINLTNDNGTLKWNNKHIYMLEHRIGEVFYTYRRDALYNENINGAYVCNGQTIEIPSTAKIIELLNNDLIPHVSFSTTITFDNTGYFGYTENVGSPKQTIRIPNLMNDNLIIQAMSNTNSIGDSIQAGIPNISGWVATESWIQGTDGCFNVFDSGDADGGGVGDDHRYNDAFTFSAVSGETKVDGTLKSADEYHVYGKSDTVQPNAVRLVPLVQILDTLELPILE